MKKYELTDDTIELPNGKKGYRIKALIDIGDDVEAGDLGGYIEKEENLSHEGKAWVFGNATVSGNARVFGNAKVFGHAQVFDKAKVYGNAKVFGHAQVFDKAKVSGDAWILVNARFGGNVRISDNAWVCDNVKIDGNAKINGDTRIDGNVANVTNSRPCVAVQVSETSLKQFESGAVRSVDADHARYDLIPRAALELMARTLKEGAERYGEYNWQKGIPNSDLINHALQHIYRWIDGDREEDHVGHALSNLAFLAHFNFKEIDKIYASKKPNN